MLDHAFGHPLELEEHAALPLAGGLMQQGYQCGMIWGAALAAGAEAFRRFGSGPFAETAAIGAARRLVETFRTRHGVIDCLDITGIDKSSSTWQLVSHFLIKGGTITCFRMAAWYGPRALDAVDAALADHALEIPAPVSCAALLARQIGESDMRATMASGLAGGIGLCGGGCGALGAAVWLLALKLGKDRNVKIDYKDPRFQAVVDGFMKHTGYEFECAAIAGRTFESIDDHAKYLRDGGCRELIDKLAAAAS